MEPASPLSEGSYTSSDEEEERTTAESPPETPGAEISGDETPPPPPPGHKQIRKRRWHGDEEGRMMEEETKAPQIRTAPLWQRAQQKGPSPSEPPLLSQSMRKALRAASQAGGVAGQRLPPELALAAGPVAVATPADLERLFAPPGTPGLPAGGGPGTVAIATAFGNVPLQPSCSPPAGRPEYLLRVARGLWR
eukprot:m51a1_g13600 hypothetical protein (193) ;mRNA; f:1213-1864